MTDHSNMKLGKQPARPDLRRRAAASLLLSHLPKPLRSVDYHDGVKQWGMMRNDVLGDCTIAALAHAVQIVTMATGKMETASDDLVESYYRQWAGYDPKVPGSDRGAYEDDVLRRFQAEGFGGKQLLSWVEVNPRDIGDVKQCITHFGQVYLGASLPMSAARQKVWDVVTPDGGLWGGHAMSTGRYDDDYVYLITWGEEKKATWSWWLRYVDECHCLILDDWLRHFPAVGRTVLLNMLNSIVLLP